MTKATLKRYIPSVRDVHGLERAPVLAEANLSGHWIPPMEVYIATDVDRLIKQLRAASRATRSRKVPDGHPTWEDAYRALADTFARVQAQRNELIDQLGKHR